jgi:3-hydroxybutyrate dehydrogenase
MRLKDKVAIVSGAASGIGKEIAVIFAREGSKVAIADLDQKAADATAKQIDPTGERAFGVAMDVANEQQVDEGMAKVVEKFGRLDVLVSNAGVQIVAPIVDFAFAEWKRLMAVHLDGAFLTTRAALRQMYKQNSGCIIYMGSVHSTEASILKAPYVTAKHGLIGLAKVVAKEGAAHGVRANVICPGFVRTPLVDKQIPEQAKELDISEQDVIKNVMLKETVDGEFTTVEDVAETPLFLASFGSNALLDNRSSSVTDGLCNSGLPREFRKPRLVDAAGPTSKPEGHSFSIAFECLGHSLYFETSTEESEQTSN